MSKHIKETDLDLINAADLLTEARLVAEFVRSIGLGPAGCVIDLNDEQTSGFCIVMRNMMDCIEESEMLIRNARASLKDQTGGEP